MPVVANHLFKALADPTRRALFERLARDGEQTVHALTDGAGISQPPSPGTSSSSSVPASCATAARAGKLTTARGPRRSSR